MATRRKASRPPSTGQGRRGAKPPRPTKPRPFPGIRDPIMPPQDPLIPPPEPGDEPPDRK